MCHKIARKEEKERNRDDGVVVDVNPTNELPPVSAQQPSHAVYYGNYRYTEYSSDF